MAPPEYTRVILNERPASVFTDKTFKVERVPYDDSLKPGPRKTLLKVKYISLDPAMRGWTQDLLLLYQNKVMRAAGLAEVLEAGDGSKYSVGDTLLAMVGMTEYVVLDDEAIFQKITVFPGTDLLDYLHTFSTTGMTAYFGVVKILDIKKGDTVVISGAGGAVGSIACQLGKQRGATVYGIAGTDEKCQWLENDLGIDKALNYKSPTFEKDFVNTVGYVDAYFDNVGGHLLDFILTRLKLRARIALCGAISQYGASLGNAYGLKNYRNLIAQRAKMEGFVVLDYVGEFAEAAKELAQGIVTGTIKRKFHVVDGGVAQAPGALPMLFKGENTGKLIVKVSD